MTRSIGFAWQVLLVVVAACSSSSSTDGGESPAPASPDAGADELADAGDTADGDFDAEPMLLPPPCSTTNKVCVMFGQTCFYPTGACGPVELEDGGSIIGKCSGTPRSADCMAKPEDPVCGCDHQTYRNECAARNKGVSVAALGACQ